MIPHLTLMQVLKDMEDAIDRLTDENYHTEAEYIGAQRSALMRAHAAGIPLAYFSWHGGDVCGLNECIID